MIRRHPVDPAALKTTGRELVQHFFGEQLLTSIAVREAIEKMRTLGWYTNYKPGFCEDDRTIILVPKSHAYEPIFRCLGSNATATIPRGLIESRTGFRLANSMTGTLLGTYGLAIVNVKDCNITVRGTSGGMASYVNSSRYGARRRVRCRFLVEAATGSLLKSRELSDYLRLKTVSEFAEYLVDVPGVLNWDVKSVVRSRWQFTLSSGSDAAPARRVPF